MKQASIFLTLVAVAIQTPSAAAQDTSNVAVSDKVDQVASGSHAGTDGRLDYALFRRNAEATIKSTLIDPGSAQIEWPYGFTYGTWKPFLKKRVSGYLTCGRVNARNRMGGYVGATAFVIVLDERANVLFKEMGTGDEIDLVSASCNKSVAMFPAPQPELLGDGSRPAPSVSIADELTKLAKLKEAGALTQDEFDAAKRQLLDRGQ